MVDTRHLIDGDEAAQMLGISKANLHMRVYRDQIPATAIVRIGSQVVYDRRVILKIAASSAEIKDRLGITDSVRIVATTASGKKKEWRTKE